MHFLESSLPEGCSSALSSESSPLPTEDPSERGSYGVTMTFQPLTNAFEILITHLPTGIDFSTSVPEPLPTWQASF